MLLLGVPLPSPRRRQQEEHSTIVRWILSKHVTDPFPSPPHHLALDISASAISISVLFGILWFYQYSLLTNFRHFPCLVDPRIFMFIEVQFLLTFCIDRIIY